MTTLPYKLMFNPNVVQELVRIGSAACLQIALSDDELLMVRSALQMGAELLYPDKSISIMHWLDDLEACMDCEQLKACIGVLFEQQNAVIERMLLEARNSGAHPGVPMTDAEKTGNLAGGSNPSCDYDVLWSQCLQVINYGVTLVNDALEIAATAVNDTQLAESISQLPGLDELGIDAIFSYIALLQDGIAENFAAQVTQAYINQTACDLFCLCQNDCSITINRVYGVFYARWVAAFGTPLQAIVTISDLLAYLIDQDIDGTTIADGLLLVVFGGGMLADVFLGDVGTQTLELLLRLAVDDASSDWSLLCACAASWSYDLDLTTPSLPAGWNVVAGTRVQGMGLQCNAVAGGGYNYGRLTFTTPVASTLSNFTITTDGFVAAAFGQFFVPYPSGSIYAYNFESQPAPGTEIDVSGLAVPMQADVLAVGLVTPDTDAVAITAWRFEGTGTNPFV